MRVTSETQYQQALLNIQSSFARITNLQNQISTGKRLHVASDDPTAMSQVLRNRLQDARFQNDLDLIRDVGGHLQAGVDVLTQIQDLLTGVKNLALQANNVTTSAATNDTLAGQVNTALDQLLHLANQTLSDGSYLFGGTASNAPPFAVAATNAAGQPAAIAYRGSLQDSQVIVSRSVRTSTLLSGNDVFQTRSRGATVYTGATGAAAGTGTDSATGEGLLTVTHLLTTYSGSSGVAAGTSAAADTVIGPTGAHTLAVSDTSGTGAGGTVSLNGGPPVSFTNLDTDLKVTGPDGEAVFIDTTAIAAGFNGTVSLTATGTLSVDGGATSVPIDFSENQVVTGTAGTITNVDSTGIRRTGTDRLHYSGTADLFQTLITLRDTISNSQGLSRADRSAALQQQIAELDRSAANVADVVGTQAVQAQSLVSLQEHLTQLRLSLGEATDNLESTDTAAAVVDLQQQMNLYQASLQIAVQINSLTVLNFLD